MTGSTMRLFILSISGMGLLMGAHSVWEGWRSKRSYVLGVVLIIVSVGLALFFIKVSLSPPR